MEMGAIDQPPFYLTFTEGWGDEAIVKCTPVADSSQDHRLVICRVDPQIFIEGRFLEDQQDQYFEKVVLFDRFASGRWLPVTVRTNVGILVGTGELEKLDPAKLQMVDWATVFPTSEEAERAREALRS